MPTILIDRIRKTFDDRLSLEPVPVIESISLQLHGPSILAIVGANGVGKTTFLRLVAGLIQPENGSILIDGTEPGKCRIGYVPQSNPVFPWRRTMDDIAIPLEVLGMSRTEREAHVRDLVRQFSFDLPLERRTHGLSGGERQLVNLCRALAGPDPPKVLLLDEPFASLDPVAREEFLSHLQKIRVELPLLIILTTHQLDYAVLASDLVLPFPNRPVRLNNSDGIRVDLGHPRSIHARTSPEFQSILERVEESFQKNFGLRVPT